jgi:RNA polymerase sigma factor (sigma-70 family)
LSDAEGQILLERFRVGDQDALDRIMKAYSSMIYGVFLSWFRLDLDDAEDLFQEVLLQLVVKADQIRNLRPWLLGTAINQARKRIRRLVRDRNLAERVQRDLATVTTPEDGSEKDLVSQALSRCSEGDRELLLLTFYGELSYKEVSARLDRPIGSIGPMRGRALARMREIVDDLERSPAHAA